MSEQERVNAGVQPATGAGEPTPIIFLDDIRVTFKTRTGSILHPNKVQAVRGLTLKLMPGETLGIVGESGCGKSTTANVMCGLQQPTSGKVFFKGEDVTKRSAAQRRLIGRVISVVFQDPATALNARMSVHDQLMDPLVVHKVGDKTSRERRVLDLIEMVGLPNSVLDALPGQLSGGQRQRVAIGRAIVRDPQVFLMDEPLSNLDAKLRNQMRAELIKLRHEIKGTFIYVTHDQTEAMTLGDRIVVMKDGVVQQIATPQEVFNHPANIFVAGFIGVPQMNFFDAQLVRSGNGFTVKTEDMNVALAPETCSQLALNWDGGDVKEITAGVRPEQILLADKGEEGALQGTVEVTELMGSTEHVHVTAPDGQFVLIIPVVDLEAKGALKAGDSIWFKFEKNATHLFDKVSGKNLI